MNEAAEPGLRGLLDDGWACLARGVGEADAPMRQLVLGTTGLDRAPRLRTVVLRAARRDPGNLDVHADIASAKVAELRRDARAALLGWDAGAAVQVRVALRMEVLTGAAVSQLWDAVPEAARGQYGGTPLPGQALSTPGDHVRRADVARFAVLRGSVRSMEILHLARNGHRRAVYAAEDGFAGRWIAP